MMHRMDMHAYYLKLLSSEKYLCFIVIFCHNEFMHLRIYGLENTLNGKKKKQKQILMMRISTLVLFTFS